jgi:hypothetical protein
MSVIRHIRRLQFIDYLIRKKATGNLEVFADKNRLSKSGLMQVLNDMKEMGFPIKYNRTLHTYFYERDGQMVQCLFIESGRTLSRNETLEVSGGDAGNLCYSETTIFERCPGN